MRAMALVESNSINLPKTLAPRKLEAIVSTPNLSNGDGTNSQIHRKATKKVTSNISEMTTKSCLRQSNRGTIKIYFNPSF